MVRLTITAPELAVALGVSTWSIYQQNRLGTLPFRALNVGKKLLWIRKEVAEALGADPLTGAPLDAHTLSAFWQVVDDSTNLGDLS